MSCLINNRIQQSSLPPTSVNPDGFADFAQYVPFSAGPKQSPHRSPLCCFTFCQHHCSVLIRFLRKTKLLVSPASGEFCWSYQSYSTTCKGDSFPAAASSPVCPRHRGREVWSTGSSLRTHGSGWYQEQPRRAQWPKRPPAPEVIKKSASRCAILRVTESQNGRGRKGPLWII